MGSQNYGSCSIVDGILSNHCFAVELMMLCLAADNPSTFSWISRPAFNNDNNVTYIVCIFPRRICDDVTGVSRFGQRRRR